MMNKFLNSRNYVIISLVLFCFVVLLLTCSFYYMRPIAVVGDKYIYKVDIELSSDLKHQKRRSLSQKKFQKWKRAREIQSLAGRISSYLLKDYANKHNITVSTDEIERKAQEIYKSVDKKKLRSQRNKAKLILNGLQDVIVKGIPKNEVFRKKLKGRIGKKEWNISVDRIRTKKELKQFEDNFDIRYPADTQDFSKMYLKRNRDALIRKKVMSELNKKYKVEDNKELLRLFFKDQYMGRNFFVLREPYNSELRELYGFHPSPDSFHRYLFWWL